jgi:hypothetical protein
MTAEADAERGRSAEARRLERLVGRTVIAREAVAAAALRGAAAGWFGSHRSKKEFRHSKVELR